MVLIQLINTHVVCCVYITRGVPNDLRHPSRRHACRSTDHKSLVSQCSVGVTVAAGGAPVAARARDLQSRFKNEPPMYTCTLSRSDSQGRLLALSRGCGAPVGMVRRKAPDHVAASLEGSRSSSSESTTAPNCAMPPRSHDLNSAQLTCRRASSDMYSRSSSTWSGQA